MSFPNALHGRKNFHCHKVNDEWPHSQWKIWSFFPKIGQIIPKLIGVIVGKNPDLVTVSGSVFF
jgi:hypothetical protein